MLKAKTFQSRLTGLRNKATPRQASAATPINRELSIELRRARTRAALQRKIFRDYVRPHPVPLPQERGKNRPLMDLIVGRAGRFTVFSMGKQKEESRNEH
jgi:hypothetical protein